MAASVRLDKQEDKMMAAMKDQAEKVGAGSFTELAGCAVIISSPIWMVAAALYAVAREIAASRESRKAGR